MGKTTVLIKGIEISCITNTMFRTTKVKRMPKAYLVFHLLKPTINWFRYIPIRKKPINQNTSPIKKYRGNSTLIDIKNKPEMMTNRILLDANGLNGIARRNIHIKT